METLYPFFSCGAGDPLPLFQLWSWRPFTPFSAFTFVQWWRPLTPFFTYHEPHHCPVVRVHDELRQAGELCSAIPAITTMYQSITSLQLHVASYHHCPLRQNRYIPCGHHSTRFHAYMNTHTHTLMMRLRLASHCVFSKEEYHLPLSLDRHKVLRLSKLSLTA